VESEASPGPANATRAPKRWRLATVARVVVETPRAKTLKLDVPDWPGHFAGQYLDVRITDATGYRTERSYSLASAPEDPQLALTVERIRDGEVSRYLTNELRVGDAVEVRGPAGDYFTWRVEDGGPLLLIGRGSGLVPLMAMLRHRAARTSTVEACMLVSARSPRDVPYREELATLEASGGLSVHYTFTREAASGWTQPARPLAEWRAAVGHPASHRPRIFICGSAPFIGTVASRLADLGYEPNTIRAQDIAPAGG
jgi:ferredoxin-NADP reductase